LDPCGDIGNFHPDRQFRVDQRQPGCQLEIMQRIGQLAEWSAYNGRQLHFDADPLVGDSR